MGKKANISAYQAAYDEWNKRVGAAKWQMRNWRLACLCSVLLSIALVVALWVLVARQQTYVYVAEVKPAENVVNVVPLDQSYTATEAQTAAFLSDFIHDMMSLPLDPVVARNNWLMTYSLVKGRAENQLDTFFKDQKLLNKLGRFTQSVVIDGYNRVSNNSYEFRWHQTTYKANGSVAQQMNYSGIFTVQHGLKPLQLQALLKNPLGLEIVYFTLRQG